MLGAVPPRAIAVAEDSSPWPCAEKIMILSVGAQDPLPNTPGEARERERERKERESRGEGACASSKLGLPGGDSRGSLRAWGRGRPVILCALPGPFPYTYGPTHGALRRATHDRTALGRLAQAYRPHMCSRWCMIEATPSPLNSRSRYSPWSVRTTLGFFDAQHSVVDTRGCRSPHNMPTRSSLRAYRKLQNDVPDTESCEGNGLAAR